MRTVALTDDELLLLLDLLEHDSDLIGQVVLEDGEEPSDSFRELVHATREALRRNVPA